MYKKIIFLVSFLVVLSCLFGFNSSVKAMSVEELVALVQKLQQQIADLQKQLSQAQDTSPAVWCHTFNKNLTAGASNEEVASLHTALEKEGFNIFDEEKANKEFDESTASAISGFQQKYADEILKPLGLKYSTGIAGKSTRIKLNALFGCNKKAEPKPFCQQTAVVCEASTKIICPAGLNDKGCPFPCKCAPPVACSQDANACPNQTTNQPPIIYGASGPTYLKINETGTWAIKASDPKKGNISYSVNWGNNEFGQTAPAVTPKSTEQSFTQSSIFTHTYNKTGIYNITFSVTNDQGSSAKTTLTVKVEENAYPTISEQVKCVFKGSQAEQKCYGASSNYTNYNCANKETCVVDVKGNKGERITWKSTCGGYAYTTIDGQNEYAEFTCGSIAPEINIISPNGQDVWELGKAFEIKWKQTQNAYVSVIARNKQLPGTGGDLWFNMNINGSVAGIVGENRVWWDIPNYLNAHTGYEICVAGSFANGTALEDCSDAPFTIHEAIVTTTPVASATTKPQSATTETPVSTTPTGAPVVSASQKSITVLSPNGGEKLLKGSTYTVKWNSSGIYTIYIKLRKGSDTYNGSEGEISKIISNAGMLLWTVPTTLPDGADYAIRIVDGTATVWDDSDSLFSITQ